MKKFTKIMALGVAFLIGLPGLAHASDVVKYDSTSLDEVLIKNGVKVDSEKLRPDARP